MSKVQVASLVFTVLAGSFVLWAFEARFGVVPADIPLVAIVFVPFGVGLHDIAEAVLNAAIRRTRAA